MTSKLDLVKQLVEQEPIPEGVIAGMDMAWAIHRKGQIPKRYLICKESIWQRVCKELGFIPAHVRCSGGGQVHISFSLDEIRR